MNDAPERIWVDGNQEWDSGSWGLVKEFAADVEYVRADRTEEIEAKLAKAVEALSPLVDASKLMQSTSGYNRHLHQQEVTSTSWSQWSKQLKLACAALAEIKDKP